MRRFPLLAAGVLLIAGCASTPPPAEEMAHAERAINRAEQAGAVEYAPLALREARDKLHSARVAVDEEEHRQARRLAAQAAADAEYAEAEARAERTEALAAENLGSLETLQQELQRREERS